MFDSVRERVLYARQLVFRHRGNFCKKYGISSSTLSQVEGGFIKLSASFAKKLVSAFQEEGLACSAEWLMDGVASPPTLLTDLSKEVEADTDVTSGLDEDRRLLMESLYFETLNKNSIVYRITQKDSHGIFSVGDYIGGIRIYDKFDTLIGRRVIAELDDGSSLVGFLAKGSVKNRYSLIPFDLQENPIQHNINLKSGAIIVWHRKKLY